MPAVPVATTLLRRWLLTGEAPVPADEPDGRACVAAAIEQGLAGLLHELVVRDRLPWPPGALDLLRDAHRSALARSVRQLETAARVLELLAVNGVRGLPLKGVAVAERLYDCVADRSMADVDILALDAFAAAERALLAADFRASEASDHASGFSDPETGMAVELHRSLTSCGAVFPFDADGLWSRSAPGAGRIQRLPAPEDLLVQLSLHAAFQHGLAMRLVQYLDFRRLFERYPPQLPALLESARGARAEAALAIALEAASTVVGAPIPAALREALAPCVPPRLGAWFSRRAAEPLTFVTPASPDLLRLRWELAAGRRWALLRAALSVAEPEPSTLWRRIGLRARRAASLAWRWSLTARPEQTRSLSSTPPYVRSPLRLLLDEFPHVRLTVTGDCMRPALDPGDTVLLAPARRGAVRFGDIVLVRLAAGLRLHRLVWGWPVRGSMRRTKADASVHWDAAFETDELLGTVIGVERPAGALRHPARIVPALRSMARAMLWRARQRGLAKAQPETPAEIESHCDGTGLTQASSDRVGCQDRR